MLVRGAVEVEMTDSPFGKTLGFARDWRPAGHMEGCIYLGCRNQVSPRYRLPLCQDHILAIWATVEQDMKSDGLTLDEVINAAAEAIRQRERDDAEVLKASAERMKRELDARPGDVYYIQVGDRVKIGHSKDVQKRLASYPPNSTVLAYHPGSRADERRMHQKFKAYLVEGREWFRDCGEIRDHIAAVVAEHGKPDRPRRFKEHEPTIKVRGKRGGFAKARSRRTPRLVEGASELMHMVAEWERAGQETT